MRRLPLTAVTTPGERSRATRAGDSRIARGLDPGSNGLKVLTCCGIAAGMASNLVIKLRAYDSHALKCASVAAAMTQAVVLDKVPLATTLKGVPLLNTAAVRAGPDVLFACARGLVRNSELAKLPRSALNRWWCRANPRGPVGCPRVSD